MEGNSICSAAFCESAALRKRFFAEFQRAEPSQSRLTACQLPRRGELFCTAGSFLISPDTLALSFTA